MTTLSFLLVFNQVGIPILTRNYGNTLPSLPLQGLLNAVNTTAKQSLNLNLSCLTSEHEDGDSTVCISYLSTSSGLLILYGRQGNSDIGECGHDQRVNILLENLNNLLTMFAGKKELEKATTSPERVSKILRSPLCLSVLDELIHCVTENESHTINFVDAVQVYPSYQLALNDTQWGLLVELLNSFAQKCSTSLGGIMYDGVLVMCTDTAWERLHYKELFLMCRLVYSSSNTTSTTKTQEHILYPPFFSPNPEKNTAGSIPFRLLAHRMTNEKGTLIDIWLLCGQEPALVPFQQIIIPSILYPNLTPPLALKPLLEMSSFTEILPKGGSPILSYVYVHSHSKRFTTWINKSTSPSQPSPSYYSILQDYFLQIKTEIKPIGILESYALAKNFSLAYLKRGDNELYYVIERGVPPITILSLGENVLAIIEKDLALK